MICHETYRAWNVGCAHHCCIALQVSGVCIPEQGRVVTILDEELMTVAEVARLFRVPVSWVYERCREGAQHPLPHLKLGKYLRFSKPSVLAYMETLRRGELRANSRKP